jgi:hypothetical protein
MIGSDRCATTQGKDQTVPSGTASRLDAFQAIPRPRDAWLRSFSPFGTTNRRPCPHFRSRITPIARIRGRRRSASRECSLSPWRRRGVGLRLAIRFLYSLREWHWRGRCRWNTARKRLFLVLTVQHLNRFRSDISSVPANQGGLDPWKPLIGLRNPGIRRDPNR